MGAIPIFPISPHHLLPAPPSSPYTSLWGQRTFGFYDSFIYPLILSIYSYIKKRETNEKNPTTRLQNFFYHLPSAWKLSDKPALPSELEQWTNKHPIWPTNTPATTTDRPRRIKLYTCRHKRITVSVGELPILDLRADWSCSRLSPAHRL